MGAQSAPRIFLYLTSKGFSYISRSSSFRTRNIRSLLSFREQVSWNVLPLMNSSILNAWHFLPRAFPSLELSAIQSVAHRTVLMTERYSCKFYMSINRRNEYLHFFFFFSLSFFYWKIFYQIYWWIRFQIRRSTSFLFFFLNLCTHNLG